MPIASHDSVSRELKLLVDRREDLVSQRSATICRLLWRVHELDPAHAPKRASLHRAKTERELGAWLVTQAGLVAELARDELSDIMTFTAQVKALERRIGVRVKAAAPSLLTICGCKELTAAKLVAETAAVSRFRSEAAFAAYAGVAPIPRSSGRSNVRLTGFRAGNRQINAALHRIAVCQIRHPGPGQTYYRKHCDTHDTPAQALRRLKRRIAHHVHPATRRICQPRRTISQATGVSRA